ncbi:MAG: Gfo/Idh/MocA family oxidoreductase [Lentisphaerae bacterium]|nr:Gfo/Idh/MocA family oxidoreductase [Lentisphaerota bacterium]
MHTMTRRTFMAATGSAMLWGTNKAWAGANDRVRVAVIGVHGMGQNHIAEYGKLPGVEVAALCDVDANQFGPVIKRHFTDKGLKTPKTYTDLRKLYADKEIDAVSVVTPNHWHTLAAIWAIQAGKHVSVEKPCCHNVFEVRHWIANGEDGLWLKGASQGNAYRATSVGNVTGNLFFGSKGYMAKDVNGWRTYMGEKREPGETGSGLGNHYENFVKAIREPDPVAFNAGIEDGFRSCALIHLGNIAFRLGRTLTFDPATLSFPGDAEANALLTREYRAPYVVPDRV